jgi:hypothetical protein
LPLNSRSSPKPVPVVEIARRSLFLSDAATKNRNRRRLRSAVRDPSIRSRCSLRQDDSRDAALAFVRLFPCVIQSRCGEESRTSFFYDAALTRFRSADSALNDTAIAVSLPQSAPRIGFGYERKVIASSGMRRNLQKSLFSRKGGRFRDFAVSHVAEREKN